MSQMSLLAELALNGARYYSEIPGITRARPVRAELAYGRHGRFLESLWGVLLSKEDGSRTDPYYVLLLPGRLLPPLYDDRRLQMSVTGIPELWGHGGPYTPQLDGAWRLHEAGYYPMGDCHFYCPCMLEYAKMLVPTYKTSLFEIDMKTGVESPFI